MASKVLTDTGDPLNVEDIQRVVLTGYGKLNHAQYMLLSIKDPVGTRAWLSRFVDLRPHSERMNNAIHVAFTYPGLRALELRQEICEEFSQEFREGMVNTYRSRILGDVGANAPENWDWGSPDRIPHILVMMYADEQSRLQSLCDNTLSDLGDSVILMNHLNTDSGMFDAQREHFGFRDGLSQPVVRGDPMKHGKSKGYLSNVIEPGEFILGYRNEYGESSKTPIVSDASGEFLLVRNGSYLVFRQLEQDVPHFWDYIKSQIADGSVDQVLALAAKMVGRTVEGVPLTDPYEPPAANKFTYANDLEGLQCPFGAHIRRANPRDALRGGPDDSLRVASRHRLLRRGRPYGPPLYKDESEIRAYLSRQDSFESGTESIPRGLHFACLNANLARQFEFVQSAWINNPKFEGLYEDPDPISPGRAEHVRPSVFTIPDRPVRRRLIGIPNCVTVKGGAYFFLPGYRALAYLAAKP